MQLALIENVHIQGIYITPVKASFLFKNRYPGLPGRSGVLKFHITLQSAQRAEDYIFRFGIFSRR